jgi:uncharacterized membrane protein
MQKLKFFTAISTAVTAVSILISIWAFFSTLIKTEKHSKISETMFPYKGIDTIENDDIKIIQTDSLRELKSVILNRDNDKYISEKKLNESITDKILPVQRFWAKIVFSTIFCIAALFVILSKKYDDETKKWAFSVLTLIAGVWIGSIT